MSDPALPPAKTVAARCGAANVRGRGARKYFPRFFPRNSLISLDSDERIQGNPNKSNPYNLEFSRRKGHPPRKPKWIDRTEVTACSRGAKSASAKGLAP